MLQIVTLNQRNFNISGQEIYQMVRKMVQTKKIIKDAFLYDLSTFYEELCKIFSGSGLDKVSDKQD